MYVYNTNQKYPGYKKGTRPIKSSSLSGYMWLKDLYKEFRLKVE